MKFVHIADLHLDTPLLALKNNRDLIKSRRSEHKQIFKDVIKFVKSEKVEMLFISGDLFEHKFVEKSTIEFIISSLELIPETKVFITPGNHDPYVKNSPYTSFVWPENVKIFGEKIEKVSCGDVDVYGFGFEGFEVHENELSDFKVNDVKKTNILITHGTLSGNSKRYNDINPKFLNQFDYVALGHIHIPKIDDNIVYPGALVACGFDECGEHGLVFGELSKKDVSYEFKNMEYRHFVDLEVDITDVKIPSDVLDKLNFEDDIYRITFTGARNIELKELEDSIKGVTSNIVEFKDETRLPYDLEEIAKQQTLKGIFTRKMLEELKNNPNQKDEIMKAIEITYAAF